MLWNDTTNGCASGTTINQLNRFKKLLIHYFCPDLYARSVSQINLRQLKSKGYTTLFIDLDNTLLGWRGKEISKEVEAWIREAKELGYKIQIVSNTFRRRVNSFAAHLGIDGISTALKPRKQVFLNGLKAVGSKPNEAVVIGDQMFTDVFGGKRLGLFTILVEPVSERELFTTHLMRIPERILLNRFRKLGLLVSA